MMTYKQMVESELTRERRVRRFWGEGRIGWVMQHYSRAKVNGAGFSWPPSVSGIRTWDVRVS